VNLWCWIGLHDWEYDKPKEVKYKLVDHWRSRVIPDSEGYHIVQMRTCERCGVAQKKEVDRYGF